MKDIHSEGFLDVLADDAHYPDDGPTKIFSSEDKREEIIRPSDGSYTEGDEAVGEADSVKAVAQRRATEEQDTPAVTFKAEIEMSQRR